MITIEEFVQIAGVKKETIYKNRNKIPGLTYRNGEYEILSGTRYPFSVRRFKIKSIDEKRYVLLKAINKTQYIDHIALELYEEEFNALLDELQRADLIMRTNTENEYGANAYITTINGSEFLQENIKRSKEKKVANLLTILSMFGRLITREGIA